MGWLDNFKDVIHAEGVFSLTMGSFSMILASPIAKILFSSRKSSSKTTWKVFSFGVISASAGGSLLYLSNQQFDLKSQHDYIVKLSNANFLIGGTSLLLCTLTPNIRLYGRIISAILSSQMLFFASQMHSVSQSKKYDSFLSNNSNDFNNDHNDHKDSIERF
mmetsp:Transcript_13964/g.21134  ORF Transcript_13964/g.21134 Transcript_13964/m.21134 type:complete len:162 (-) Transcript_13964:153-638(-)